MTFALIVYALCVCTLTTAEWRGDSLAQGVLKPLCALGFLLIAIMCGALDSLYGLLILLALMLCAVGDVALLSRDKPKLFLLGMAAFGLGHLVFAVAFFGPYMSQAMTSIGLALAIILGGGFATSIWKDVPRDIRVAVGIYIAIIGLMIISAFSTGFVMITVGATLFAFSDLFVARDRFVTRAPWHPFVITPLYFGAQALFALSILQF